MSNRERMNLILQQVESLSPQERAQLAHEILREIESEPLALPPRNTLGKARGLLHTDHPPTDEEVERWIDEYRMHKYGQR